MGCGRSFAFCQSKKVILIALTSASRASALHHFDIPYMVRIPHKCIFTFHKLHKSWGKGAPLPQLCVPEYLNPLLPDVPF